MTTYYKQDGKYLKVGGKYAVDAACCCASCVCRLPPDASETFELTFGTASPAGCPTGTKTLSWIGAPTSAWTFGACICNCAPPDYDYWDMQLECVDGAWVLAVVLTWKSNSYTASVAFTCTQNNPAILSGTLSFTGLPLDYVGSTTLTVDFTLEEIP